MSMGVVSHVKVMHVEAAVAARIRFTTSAIRREKGSRSRSSRPPIP